jgi:hypothetical protein
MDTPCFFIVGGQCYMHRPRQNSYDEFREPTWETNISCIQGMLQADVAMVQIILAHRACSACGVKEPQGGLFLAPTYLSTGR